MSNSKDDIGVTPDIIASISAVAISTYKMFLVAETSNEETCAVEAAVRGLKELESMGELLHEAAKKSMHMAISRAKGIALANLFYMRINK